MKHEEGTRVVLTLDFLPQPTSVWYHLELDLQVKFVQEPSWVNSLYEKARGCGVCRLFLISSRAYSTVLLLATLYKFV